MNRIAYLLGAVVALTSVLFYMAGHPETPMKKLPRSLESRFLPDTATGG